MKLYVHSLVDKLKYQRFIIKIDTFSYYLNVVDCYWLAEIKCISICFEVLLQIFNNILNVLKFRINVYRVIHKSLRDFEN